jgi:hypothetical protein
MADSKPLSLATASILGQPPSAIVGLRCAHRLLQIQTVVVLRIYPDLHGAISYQQYLQLVLCLHCFWQRTGLKV